MRIGIISDTHGLLRPEVFDAFAGVDHILHAGDIGDPDILIELRAIAPVTAVSGNTDDGAVRERVKEVETLSLGGVTIVVTHGHRLGSPTPQLLAAQHAEADLIVFGHTHRPLIERVGEITVVNPGSAGPRRFKLPVGVAVATVENGRVDARLRELG